MDEDTAQKKARNIALRLLTYRARSRKEVADHLEKKGFHGYLTATILTELEDYGYIDDEKFTLDFINYRKKRGLGLIRIRYELLMKGIDKEIVDTKIDECFDPEDDFKRIKDILTKRAGKDQQVCENWMKRQFNYLKKRGFQDSLIRKALLEYPVNDYNYSE